MGNNEDILLNILDGVKNIRQKNSIVFHLTNLLTLNDCANVTVAMGGVFTTSFYEEEFEDILKFSSAVVLNTAAMDEKQIKWALKIGKIANSLEKPVVLAPVGITVSKPRRKLHEELLKEVKFAVLRVGIPDLKTLLNIKNSDMNCSEYTEIESIKKAAELYDTVIAITGARDYIGDKNKVIEVQNGDTLLEKIVGPGCMMTSLIGYFLGGGTDGFTSALSGVAVVDIAGELAGKRTSGVGTFKVNVMDMISNMDEDMVKNNLVIALV